MDSCFCSPKTFKDTTHMDQSQGFFGTRVFMDFFLELLYGSCNEGDLNLVSAYFIPTPYGYMTSLIRIEANRSPESL